MGFKLGPQTGARDGSKEFRANTRLRGLDTGSRYDDEAKAAKKAAKAAARAEKKARKK